MQNFSLLIPTLNEAENIGPLLERLQRVTAQLGAESEIIFIDDGSADGTREKIISYRGPLRVRLVRREHQRGLTGAVVAGARAAEHDLVVVMDSDLSHPPEQIPDMLAQLAEGRCDMVIGSRYVAGGGTPGWPLFRRIASLLASLPARLLTGVRDPLAGFLAVHRRHLVGIDNGLRGFKVGLEVMARADAGFTVREVPIIFQDRHYGNSKMRVGILGKYLGQLLRLSGERLNSHCSVLLPLLIAALCGGLLDGSLFSLLTSLGYGLDISHAASFLMAAFLAYGLATLLETRQGPTARPHRVLPYTAMTLLLLFLRGGVLTIPALRATSPSLSLLAVLAAGTSLALATALLVSKRTAGAVLNWRIYGTLLIVYTIMLRLVYLGRVELLQEEAYYWNYAQHLAPGYLDHPPMVALLIHLGTMLFGDTELGVRFGAFFCWFITSFFVYLLARAIFDRQAGFLAVILVAVLPIFFGVALVMTPDAPLIASWSGALYFLYRALVREHSGAWYWAGICLGLGMTSKYTIAFLGPAIILFMLLDAPSRKWFTKPQPYLAVLLALAVFAPVIWWNSQHDWASFLFQSRSRILDRSEFSTHELLAAILVLISPTGFLAAAAILKPQERLRLYGIGAGDAIDRRGYYFGVAMAIIPLAIFAVFSISREIKLNWTGPLWLSLLPFMACTMSPQKDSPRQLLPRLWPGTLMVLVLAYGGLLHYCAVGLPGFTFGNSRNFLFGWDDLASQLDEKITLVTARNGERPLVAGMDHYRLASGLAFYRSKEQSSDDRATTVNETTGRQLFGSGALMYDYWLSPAAAEGRDILVVAQRPEQLAPERLAGHSRQLGDLGEISVTKLGKKAGRYYYRLLTWYTPGTIHNHAGPVSLRESPRQQQRRTAQASPMAATGRGATL